MSTCYTQMKPLTEAVQKQGKPGYLLDYFQEIDYGDIHYVWDDIWPVLCGATSSHIPDIVDARS